MALPSPTRRPTRHRRSALLAVAAVAVAACTAQIDVTAESSDLIAQGAAPDQSGTVGSGEPLLPNEDEPVVVVDDQLDGSTDDPAADSPIDDAVGGGTGGPFDNVSNNPGEATGDDSQPGPTEVDPLAIDPDSIDFGDQKPAQPWDEFALASATDVEAWLTDVFPELYGAEWQPLQGGLFAAYPSREDDLPGCASPRTTYRDVSQFAAFYCALDDFIIYDDGPNGLLGQLSTTFGPATLGIVLAHEYAHALQQRIGALARRLPTVVTEQQADCFAGAWAGQNFRGEQTGVPFSDSDIRAGLIAMIEVEDPIGTDQLDAGGHGSGFDRVGAFQLGFGDGPAACVPLLDDPLPLSLNQFTSQDDLIAGGNAPFSFGDGGLFDFLPEDLNLFWGEDVAARFPGFEQLTIAPVAQLADATCQGSLRGTDGIGAYLCLESSTVFVVEGEARVLYDDFGDFSIGYGLGKLWAEAVQATNGSDVTGEARALLNDCLTGAWVSTVIPEIIGDTVALPQPRAENRGSSLSPGDLTEAIQTAILIGDATIDTNEVGFPFEKIDAFREGTLGGLDACLA